LPPRIISIYYHYWSNSYWSNSCWIFTSTYNNIHITTCSLSYFRGLARLQQGANWGHFSEHASLPLYSQL
jgi:hypothetical protein